jgi:hypothetical protein
VAAHAQRVGRFGGGAHAATARLRIVMALTVSNGQIALASSHMHMHTSHHTHIIADQRVIECPECPECLSLSLTLTLSPLPLTFVCPLPFVETTFFLLKLFCDEVRTHMPCNLALMHHSFTGSQKALLKSGAAVLKALCRCPQALCSRFRAPPAPIPLLPPCFLIRHKIVCIL